ncbi:MULTISPECIES: TcpQ domain-containing protein [unclassified Pseudomonas]|uniref:PFGI-1 class ICE element type IV pilus protein PilL2 n=1 Tax=unclassified Pseudomonas TaxID=196821 RepID=UPI00162225E4|nr:MULTISPECIES: TcpQ domain-containing protein [unclassified Pseudomonas]MBB6288666.1 type IV pili sensor histidine kinase/response regulator [Pseudomonas sp. SJZ073]MBB6313638.1 type IV pili sensor histidine kinase/response regulator [Pseudomonas sp. JAI120]
MIRHVTTLSLLALIASCTTQTAQTPKPDFDSSRNPDMLTPDLYPGGAVPEKEPVVRYGRYTLVSTLPDSGQRDLMAQIIDISIPANMHPNVREAMQYVVDRSGYTLCSADTGHVNILYTRPLPAAQYKLGPMTLRNTLQVLAGPAWQVKVDEVNRQVCYVLRPGYQLPDSPRPASAQVAQLKAPSTVQPAPATPIKDDSSGGVVVAAVPQTAPFTATATTAAPVTNAAPAKTVTTPSAIAKDGSAKQTSSLLNPGPVSAKSSSINAKATTATPPVTQAMAPAIPATPVIPVIAAPKPLAQLWTASTGSSLRQTVEGWAEKAHWRLIWQIDDLDYPIEAPLRFEGSFEEAIREIFPLYDSAPRSFVVDGVSSQMLIYIAERKK